MSSPVRCAIIEDEPFAQELLERYVRRVHSLVLIATCDDALVALRDLPPLRPDLLFVDINMPELTGLELLRAYPAPHPIVILTTANPNHALDGFDFGVADYLLKPITFERFSKAVDRAALHLPPQVQPSDCLFVKTDGQIERVFYDEIVFMEALGDYVKVHLAERDIVTHATLTKLADQLPTDQFARINRSYVVQLRRINRLVGNTVMMSTGQCLPIGTNYRLTVKKQIQQWLVHP